MGVGGEPKVKLSNHSEMNSRVVLSVFRDIN